MYIPLPIYIYTYVCMHVGWVGTYAVQYVCRYNTNMPNIQNVLTNIGHRLGHQSGLDESSGRISTTFLYGIEFRVHFVCFIYK